MSYFLKLMAVAKEGDPTAQHALGMKYHDGEGVAQDHALASKWILLAAGQRMPESA